MIRTALGILCSAGMAAALSAPVLAVNDTARISGWVLDGKTHAPLVAKVTILEQNGRTVELKPNGKGHFSAIGLEPGYLTVTISAEGFFPQAKRCKVPGGDTGNFDFRGYPSDRAVGTAVYRCGLEPSPEDRYVIQ